MNIQSPLPLVSIGLPVHNGEEFLASAIESILSQTYSHFELIISDNASTDGTQAICRAFAALDNRVRYVRNKTNAGAARNYNATVERATGTYFKWASHDDLCRPTFIQRCVDVLETYPEVVLAYPKTIIINESGNVINDRFEDLYNLRWKTPSRRYKAFTKTPLDCNPVFGLMRLSALRRTPGIGPYESSDRVLLGELALLGEIAEVPERLFLRRYHPHVSTFACKSKKEIAAWFDPSSTGRFTRLQRFVEYIRSIYRVHLSFGERFMCVWYLLLFYAQTYTQPARWGRIVKQENAKFSLATYSQYKPAKTVHEKEEIY
ncbi:MAG: glycosyltransferase family 2 protein [Bacteroidetes bacterium]|nr:glycosyltransferase family 2 protein [Bacteroidota bacterium]MCW5897206.1 glycosyltransferase family 2 protein [Bacteroidota bacterium]